MTMSTTIRPTANGMLPFERSASFRRKGAPAATPTSSKPTPSGSSRPNTLASPMATTGPTTKLASKESATSRPFRSGARICCTVSARPTARVLDTTNTTTEAFAPLINSFVKSMIVISRLIWLPHAATVGQEAKRPDSRQEEVGATLDCRKRGQALDLLFDRPLRNRHVVRAVVRADNRVPLVAKLLEFRIVDPDVLEELELADQAATAHECRNAPFDAVVAGPFRQGRTIRPAAPDDSTPVHVVPGVAEIHAPDVGAERRRVPLRVHLCVIEVVVALWIGRELGIVLRGRQRQRCAAAPAAHQLRRDQLLAFRRGPAVLPKEIAKPADVLLHLPIREKASVLRQDLGLQERDVAVLVRVPEEELSWLERSSGTRRRRDPHSVDFRLRHAIPISEMIVGVLERRRRLEIERRQRFDARKLRGILLMFLAAPLPLRRVAREQDHDCMKFRTGEAAHPMIGMVRARIAQHLRARRHALAELLRKRRERRLVDAQRSQAVERKSDGDPSRVERISRRHRAAAADAIDDPGEPRPSLIRLAEPEESVPRGERARSSQQEVLNVVQF